MRIHEEEGLLTVLEHEPDVSDGPFLTGRALEMFTLLDALFGLEEAAGEERAAAE